MALTVNTLQLGKEVPLESIQSELRSFWSGDASRTRASLINFVVYSEKENALESNCDIARDITRDHACRALLVQMDFSEEQKAIRSWVTAHCHLVGGKKSVCSEQVSFYMTGVIKGRMNNTVFSNVDSDLPLVFWWQNDLNHAFVRDLYERIDRLIIDSSTWQEQAQGFQTISEAIAETDLIVQDLAWTRAYFYRMAIANLYDAPLAQESIEKTNTIELTVHPEHLNTGLYLLAWFVERAGWKRAHDLLDDGAAQKSFRFEKQNGDLVDVMITEDATGEALSLFKVTADDVEVAISRDKGSRFLRERLSSASSVVDDFSTAGSIKDSDIVGQQLSRGSKNTLYKGVLPTFYDLKGLSV